VHRWGPFGRMGEEHTFPFRSQMAKVELQKLSDNFGIAPFEASKGGHDGAASAVFRRVPCHQTGAPKGPKRFIRQFLQRLSGNSEGAPFRGPVGPRNGVQGTLFRRFALPTIA
jgi:hypothetical protein